MSLAGPLGPASLTYGCSAQRPSPTILLASLPFVPGLWVNTLESSLHKRAVANDF